MLGFALVAVLALSGGGFDDLLRSDVGIALWWMLLVGVLVGVLPLVGLGRGAWTAVLLLVALGLWTATSVAWSGSAERSLLEAGRVATYAAALLLGLATQRRVGGRALLNGVGAAIVLAGSLGVLSRLHPAWFPRDDVAAFLGQNGRRLNYPLNYWNGLACFIALGLPLMCVAARSAASRVSRALAASSLPVLVLCIYLTVSRGGIIAGVAGVAVLMAMVRGRALQLIALAPAALGSAIVVAAVAQRHALRTDAGGPVAAHQGDVILVLCLVVVAGVALVQVTLDAWLANAGERWAAQRASLLRATGIAAVAVAIVAALAAGAPSRISHAWTTFKNPNTPETVHQGEDVFARLGNPAGNGRYQYWMSAKQAGLDHPFKGIGAGTFEFYWARHPTFDGPYITHAHSLWWETFGELGIPGLLLVLGLFAVLVGLAVVRTLRAPPAVRATRAAALASLVTFCIFATYDWVWDIPVIPIAALLLAAVAIVDARSAGDEPRRGRRWPAVVLAVAGLGAIVVPLGGVAEVRASQQASARGDVGTALADARGAVAASPYSAAAHLQEALVLEQLGRLEPSRAQAREATRLEPDNWQLWVVRSRLEARTGAVGPAIASYRRARALNPASPLFRKP